MERIKVCLRKVLLCTHDVGCAKTYQDWATHLQKVIQNNQEAAEVTSFVQLGEVKAEGQPTSSLSISSSSGVVEGELLISSLR